MIPSRTLPSATATLRPLLREKRTDHRLFGEPSLASCQASPTSVTVAPSRPNHRGSEPGFSPAHVSLVLKARSGELVLLVGLSGLGQRVQIGQAGVVNEDRRAPCVVGMQARDLKVVRGQALDMGPE